MQIEIIELVQDTRGEAGPLNGGHAWIELVTDRGDRMTIRVDQADIEDPLTYPNRPYLTIEGQRGRRVDFTVTPEERKAG